MWSRCLAGGVGLEKTNRDMIYALTFSQIHAQNAKFQQCVRLGRKLGSPKIVVWELFLKRKAIL